MSQQDAKLHPGFRANVTVLSAEEGGRRLPIRQGHYRPTLHFPGDEMYIGLIETRFLDPHGNPIPDGEVVPYSALADILVYDDEGLRELLRKRVFQGAEFDLTEGLYVVARAVVVSVGEV
ncbi:MAG: hypothetical protein ACYDDQ_12560 [Vulcanimicrobiaceae bacterium]